jgi:hypothetical protein
MTQVFVWYSILEHASAAQIMLAIEEAGLTYAYPGQLPVRIMVTEKLQDEIERAECIVVVWTQKATPSFQLQVRQAIHAWASDRLVLAVLDDAPLPVGLRDLPIISIRGGSDHLGTQRLIERIRAILADRERRGVKAPLRESTRRSKDPAWPIIASVLIPVFAILGSLWLQAPPLPLPSPPQTAGYPPVITTVLVILTVLVLGAAIGAAAVWVWSARSNRRSNLNLTPSAPRQATASSGASQIFVSYSHHDGQTVEHLVQQIEQLGYGVWIDRATAGSQRYAAPIVRAIRTSRLVALMGSQNAFTSDHVIREVYVAGDYKKPFIIFELDSTEFPEEIVYFVSGFPRIPVATMDSQRLRSEIARLVAA